MKRITVFLAAAIALAVLSGCAIVPLGWHDGGGYGHGRGYGRGGYRYAPYGYYGR